MRCQQHQPAGAGTTQRHPSAALPRTPFERCTAARAHTATHTPHPSILKQHLLHINSSRRRAWRRRRHLSGRCWRARRPSCSRCLTELPHSLPACHQHSQQLPCCAAQQLAIVVARDGRVLLGRKKTGFGAGYYNGFGGKVHPDIAASRTGTHRQTLCTELPHAPRPGRAGREHRPGGAAGGVHARPARPTWRRPRMCAPSHLRCRLAVVLPRCWRSCRRRRASARSTCSSAACSHLRSTTSPSHGRCMVRMLCAAAVACLCSHARARMHTRCVCPRRARSCGVRTRLTAALLHVGLQCSIRVRSTASRASRTRWRRCGWRPLTYRMTRWCARARCVCVCM